MYWTDAATEKVQRANLDGSAVEDVVAGLDFPLGIALDSGGSKVYWCETVSGPDKIQRANRDGSNVEDVVVGLDVPSGLALDLAAGKAYWTVGTTGDVLRANLDGSSIETLIDLTQGHVNDIALDLVERKMYFTVLGAPESVRRADLDGSNMEALVSEAASVFGIAIDLAAANMYWARSDAILRANLDGSDVESLDVPNATALALDPVQGKLYWTSVFLSKIQRSDLDGSSVEDIITGLGTPRGIALDPSEPTPVPDHGSPRVQRWAISNHPNPFNPSTMIRYTLPKDGVARLRVYGLSGRLVVNLVEAHRSAGDHTATWDGRDHSGHRVAPGTYFLRLQAGGESVVRKVVFVGE